MKEEILTERIRAEDILLGSLGFAEDASIVTVELTPAGYRGTGKWQDGEQFNFVCEDDVDELQRWALKVLIGS
ncbi:MAG: hypothetical protein J5J00_16140 [Deltaproteobacteria bacterium]|nr:hypothetical protein [Deltaproteobacteria bacterium]